MTSEFAALNRRDLSDFERVATVVATMAACALTFALTWLISSRWAPVKHHFDKFDFKNRCDFASRIPSVIHALVVLYFLWDESLYNVSWDVFFQTRSDLRVLERNMCISMGYFLYDFIVIVWSRMDLWGLYVYHHISALAPLFMVLFGGCETYTFFGSGYFFVEMTILPLQIVNWFETFKRPDHWMSSVAYHITFWLWVPFRTIFPVWITYQGIGVVMQVDDVNGFWQCKVPVGYGGMAIWTFCWLVFFAHVLPAYIKRVVHGHKPAQHAAPANKERRPPPAGAVKAAKRAQEANKAPMSPVMSPTLKPPM